MTQKTAIVTGAASGIGLAIARDLAEKVEAVKKEKAAAKAG